MRELKLKYFWNKEWHYIDLYKDNTRAKFEAYESVNKTSQFYQFTGKTDKNREMWESDLYELLLNGIETHTELVIYEIRWNDKVCGFGFFKITKDSDQPEWIGLNDKSVLDKVYKGNIHQDKHLLK